MIHVPRCRVDPTCRFAPGQLRFHEHRTRLRLAALVILYVTSLPAMKLPYYYPCCMQTQLHLLKSHVFCWPLWYLSCQPFCNNISNKNPVNKAVTVLSLPCLADNPWRYSWKLDSSFKRIIIRQASPLLLMSEVRPSGAGVKPKGSLDLKQRIKRHYDNVTDKYISAW